MARMKFLCDADRCIECNACVDACTHNAMSTVVHVALRKEGLASAAKAICEKPINKTSANDRG